MDEQRIELKGRAIGAIVGNVVGLAAAFLIAWIFDINPSKEYGWFAGFFHGVWVPVNWIMSWFSDAVLVKAPVHTTAYGVFWWIGIVCGVWQWIKLVLVLIGNAKLLKALKE